MDIELDEMNFNNLDYGALGRIRIGSMALSTLISAVLTFITCFIVMQIILKTLERILGRANKIDGTLKGFIHSAVKIILWILTGIIVAGALGIPTTSLVALISIDIYEVRLQRKRIVLPSPSFKQHAIPQRFEISSLFSKKTQNNVAPNILFL